MKRSALLSLKKETLVALTGDDLAFVGGAEAPVPGHTLEIPCLIRFSPSFSAPTQCCTTL